MPYLNLDLDYFNHPKTMRLIGLLGRSSELLPIKLWVYCGKFHAEGGELLGYSTNELESLVGWWGKPGQAIEALVRVGFLERDGDGLRVHEWDEHEGHIAAFKARARDAALARWSKEATSIPQASYKQSPNLPNQPNQPTVPTRSKWTPPSLDEVSAYCRERANGIDPSRFIDFYSAKGWMIGKNPMKDWHAAIRTWEKKQGEWNGTNRQGNTGRIVGSAAPAPGKYDRFDGSGKG